MIRGQIGIWGGHAGFVVRLPGYFIRGGGGIYRRNCFPYRFVDGFLGVLELSFSFTELLVPGGLQFIFGFVEFPESLSQGFAELRQYRSHGKQTNRVYRPCSDQRCLACETELAPVLLARHDAAPLDALNGSVTKPTS